MKLSLCMIVRDEAANLDRCLQSVAGGVDELVIVDTGSRDETIAIAQSYGAKVVPFEWCDDFSAARNYSLAQATGDWILVLDADEVLQPEVIPAIRWAIDSGEYLAVNLLRYELGTQQAPFSMVSRLFQNRPNIRFTRPYHELIDDSVAVILEKEPQWLIGQLPGVAIHHTGYQTSTVQQRQKHDRAKRIMASYLAENPKDAYIANKLGALYLDLGDRAKAQELLEWAITSPQIEAPVLYELHYHLGSAYDDPLKAVEQYQLALAQPIEPTLKLGAYVNLGNLCLDLGQAAEAKVLYEQAIAIMPDFATGHYNLGKSLKTLGDLPGAIAAYQQATTLNPEYAEAYQNLGVTFLKLGQVTSSIEAFHRSIALHQQQGNPEGDRLAQTLQEMGLL